jgi:hypothetical protein
MQNTTASIGRASRVSLLTLIISVLVVGCCRPTPSSPAADGWTVLFDGSSTAAWRGYKRADFPADAWVIDGNTLKTVPGHEVDLITREQYQDFDLELEWKVAKESNSGIMFHVTEDFPETYFTGPEMQVVDDDNTKDGRDPKTSAGSLYALIAPQNKKYNPYGQWNKARIVVQGPHVEYWLNGGKVLEYELGSEKFEKLVAASKFNTMPKFAKKPTGYISLQNHGGELWYRNVKVRRL